MAKNTDYEVIKNARGIFVGNLPNVSLPERTHMLRFAKEHRVKTFVNFGVTDCRRKFADICEPIYASDFVILNLFEFADMVRKKPHQILLKSNLKCTVSQLKNTATTLVVTNGENGAYAYTSTEIFHAPAIRPKKIIDMTGAGDGFCAGFISAILKEHSIPEALLNGVSYAAAKIGHLGAN